MTIRVLLVDGDTVARTGIRAFLRGSEVEIVAEARGGSHAIEIVKSNPVDLVLLALRLAESDGYATLEALHAIAPRLPVLVLSDVDQPAIAARAHQLKASGCLLKTFDAASLLSAIRAAASGSTTWTRDDLRRITGVASSRQFQADIDTILTPREHQVLREIIRGRSNGAIAEALGISYETVKEHVQHLLRKLGVQDRTQAAIWAVRLGLQPEMPPEPPQPVPESPSVPLDSV